MTPNSTNLMEKMDYHGPKQVLVGNGAGLTINHVGYSKFQPFSCSSPLKLNNLLHVPNITKNLLSVAQFARITMCSLSFIMIFALLNVKLPRRYFSKEPLSMAYTALVISCILLPPMHLQHA